MSDRPPLTVVVPTRDRPEHLHECLTALVDELGPEDELVVADSASRDPEVGRVAASLGARVVRCELKGASRARNAGARAATNPLVVFVDDDVRVTEGWSDAMAAALTSDGVDFVCGRVTAPPQQDRYSRPVALNPSEERQILDHRSVVEMGNSANLGISRDAFEAVGGFDESLGAGTPYVVEDHDLFDRLVGAGFVGRHEPTALGWHDQWRSRSDLLALDWRYGLGSGARLSKLLRTDRARARRVLRAVTWETDVLALLAVIRQRHEFAALTISVRLAGTLAGFVVACTWPIRLGHFRR